jgi:hypothetical protein
VRPFLFPGKPFLSRDKPFLFRDQPFLFPNRPLLSCVVVHLGPTSVKNIFLYICSMEGAVVEWVSEVEPQKERKR